MLSIKLLSTCCFLLLLLVVQTANSLGNTNRVGSGVVCVIQATNILNQTPRGCTSCTLNSNFANCINQALVTSGLTFYCSSNMTNSTIPSGTCTACTASQVTQCNMAMTITNNALITDAVFSCLIRTCSGNPRIRYFGTIPVRLSDKVFVGFGSNSNSVNSLTGRKKRSDQTDENRFLANVAHLDKDIFKDAYLTKIDNDDENSETVKMVLEINERYFSQNIPVITVDVEEE